MYTNEIKNINTPFGKTNNFAFPTSLVANEYTILGNIA